MKENRDRVKKFYKYVSSHKIISAIIILGIIVIALGNFTSALDGILSFLKSKLPFINTETIGFRDRPECHSQNPDAKWEYYLGEEKYNGIKEKYLNTIANLTLLTNPC